MANENFIKSANRQQVNFDRQKGKMSENYELGDTVGVRIDKVDRTNTSIKIMPCKVYEKTNDKFKVYTKSGLVEGAFNATDLVDMRNINYSSLQSTKPDNLQKLSLTTAFKLHTEWRSKSSSICKCKKDGCSTKRCACRKNNNTCSTKCHPGQRCGNV